MLRIWITKYHKNSWKNDILRRAAHARKIQMKQLLYPLKPKLRGDKKEMFDLLRG